jgi:hypothetical protein
VGASDQRWGEPAGQADRKGGSSRVGGVLRGTAMMESAKCGSNNSGCDCMLPGVTGCGEICRGANFEGCISLELV